MANITTQAKAIVQQTQNPGEQAVLLALAIDDFEKALVAQVESTMKRLNRQATWREQLVLVHHGITKSNAKAFTEAEYMEFLSAFDHSNCPIDSWDSVNLKVKKGCPKATELAQADAA